MLLFQPKYRLAHPENYLFLLFKTTFSGSKYPKNILYNFEKRSTNCRSEWPPGPPGLKLFERQADAAHKAVKVLLPMSRDILSIPEDCEIDADQIRTLHRLSSSPLPSPAAGNPGKVGLHAHGQDSRRPISGAFNAQAAVILFPISN